MAVAAFTAAEDLEADSAAEVSGAVVSAAAGLGHWDWRAEAVASVETSAAALLAVSVVASSPAAALAEIVSPAGRSATPALAALPILAAHVSGRLEDIAA